MSSYFSQSRSLSSSPKLHQSRDALNDIPPSARLSLKNKSILITGGGRGIGFAIARSIAQEGGNIAIIDTLPSPVPEFHSLASTHNVKTSYTQGDVTSQSSLETAFQTSLDALDGELAGCVSAAGIAIDKPFLEHNFEESKRVLEVNTLGTFWTVKLAAEKMKSSGQGGSIVMIASIAAQGLAIPKQRLSIYNMSKAAVKGLAGPLAVELGELGVRVNTISPSFTESPMSNALKDLHPDLLNTFQQAAPLKRIGHPSDLTPAVVYLLSDASSFTTGADIVITGGLHAGIAESCT